MILGLSSVLFAMVTSSTLSNSSGADTACAVHIVQLPAVKKSAQSRQLEGEDQDLNFFEAVQERFVQRIELNFTKEEKILFLKIKPLLISHIESEFGSESRSVLKTEEFLKRTEAHLIGWVKDITKGVQQYKRVKGKTPDREKLANFIWSWIIRNSEENTTSKKLEKNFSGFSYVTHQNQILSAETELILGLRIENLQNELAARLLAKPKLGSTLLESILKKINDTAYNVGRYTNSSLSLDEFKQKIEDAQKKTLRIKEARVLLEELAIKRSTLSRHFLTPFWPAIETGESSPEKMNLLKQMGGAKKSKKILELLEKIQDARSQFLNFNYGLVLKEANKLHQNKYPDVPVEFLVEDGLESLLMAMDGFNFRSGNKFSTYAINTIENNTLKSVEKYRKRAYEASSLDIPATAQGETNRIDLIGSDPEISETAEKQAADEKAHLLETLRLTIEDLPEGPRKALKRNFGLFGEKKRSIKVIAKELERPRKKVRADIDQAMQELRVQFEKRGLDLEDLF